MSFSINSPGKGTQNISFYQLMLKFYCHLWMNHYLKDV